MTKVTGSGEENSDKEFRMADVHPGPTANSLYLLVKTR